MIHKMNLAPWAYDAIRSGKKTVEMRLYDEKRAKIKIGDKIEFENRETHEKLTCMVKNLSRYKDFFELYDSFDKIALGYNENEEANAEDMNCFYSKEEIEKYGVLAIEIEVTF